MPTNLPDKFTRLTLIALVSVALSSIAAISNLFQVSSPTLEFIKPLAAMVFPLGLVLGGMCVGLMALLIFLHRQVLRSSINQAKIVFAIFLCTFTIYFFGCKISSSFDSRWTIHTTMSMLKEGNTDLDEYRELIEQDQYYAIYRVNGHLYNMYPPGTSLLALPYVAFMDNFYKRSLALDLERYIRTEFPRGLEIFIASQLVAFTTVLIYLMGNLFFKKRRYALGLAFIFTFCTSAWSTASRALWQHGPSALMVALALYLLLLAGAKPRYTSHLICMLSLPLAFSFLIRPTNAVSILLLTLVVFVQHRKHFPAYCLWGLIVSVPFVMFSLAVYHSLLPPYYLASSQLHFGIDTLSGLIGTLFSPSRGLFIFTPVLLFSFYGVVLKIRRKQMELLDYALVISMLLHWVISSSHPHWWGGHSYGPRYFTDILPYFMYFLIPLVDELLHAGRIKKAVLMTGLALTVAISFCIHLRGATNWDVHYWNSEPVSVDDNPSRVWDWRDIQFLRGL